MSVTGRTIDTIYADVVAALSGQTITSGSESLTLNPSATPWMLWTSGANVNCLDGSFIVTMNGSGGAGVPLSTGSFSQIRFDHSITVTVALHDCVNPSGWGTIVIAYIRQIMNLINAALEPTSSDIYAVRSRAFQSPRRAPSGFDGWTEVQVNYTIQEFWER